MRTIIKQSDINKLHGCFCVELSFDQEDIDITQSKNPDFWLEKRIKFISIVPLSIDGPSVIVLNGIYYTNRPITPERFLERWNGIEPEEKEEGKKRFLRLLNKKELQWLFNQLVEKQNHI
jgi:hypothetical protein